MRSVVPSESVTVPLPAHVPSKPANGPDWAFTADTDSMSAAPTPATLIACPNQFEPNSFISRFPSKLPSRIKHVWPHRGFSAAAGGEVQIPIDVAKCAHPRSRGAACTKYTNRLSRAYGLSSFANPV